MTNKLSRKSSAAAIFATALLCPTLAAQPPADLQLVQVASGFTRPVTVRHAGDGSGRLFVVEQAGRIRIIDAGGSVLPAPFLDIVALVDDGGNEQGLLGLDFHPDYDTNGFFYVNYTRDPGPGLDRTVIARYEVSAGNPDVADPASATTLLEIEQDFSNHNGGNILFGPDGFLYIGMGDGGSGGDPFGRAQDSGELLGKMLRIDVDGASRGSETCGLVGNYGIPAGNPFPGIMDGCDEIWAFGLRNPWRFSFDRATGDMLIGDVGQDAWEEIDFQPGDSSGGENYGWDCREGLHPFEGCGGTFVDPILEFANGSDCSVTGGYRYRGHQIAGFDGTYVYADFCSGKIWFGTENTEGLGGWSSSLWQNTSFSIASFGEDEQGEVYLTAFNGTVQRFVSPSTIFVDGFESGDGSAWSSQSP